MLEKGVVAVIGGVEDEESLEGLGGKLNGWHWEWHEI